MKIVVMSNNVCFYTTPEAIENGVGDSVQFNAAVREVYEALTNYNREVEKTKKGYIRTYLELTSGPFKIFMRFVE